MQHRRTFGVALGLVTVLTLSLLPASPVAAATLTVTRTNDPAPNGCRPNDCSLREAVIASNNRPGDDVIVLKAKRYNLTIGGADEDSSRTGDLDLLRNVRVVGAGPRTPSSMRMASTAYSKSGTTAHRTRTSPPMHS